MKREGIDIVTAIRANAVPEYIANAIVDVGVECKCGAVLEFDPCIRRIRCSAERCQCKVNAEAERALMALGISAEEIDAVKDIIDRELTGKDAGCWILSSENEEIERLVSRGKNIEFNKILSVSGVKVLGDSSECIIEGYRSLVEFSTNLKKYGAIELARRLKLDKEISIAATIYEELIRVIPALIAAEHNLTVTVKRSEKVKQLGGGAATDNTIYTALQADADNISSEFIVSNASANELVEKINEDRKIKGKDILRLV